MIRIDEMKTGKQYSLKKKDGKELEGILVEKDDLYLFLKNVKMGQRFCSMLTVPIKELVKKVGE